MLQHSESGVTGGEWTRREIEARLGVSTVVFRQPPYPNPLSAREISTIRETGITRIEITGIRSPQGFDFGSRSQISEIKTACRNEGVSVVSVHGPSLSYDSEDETERQLAVANGVIATKVAEEFEAGVIVFHFGTNKCAERSVSEVIQQTEGSAVKLAVENGKDLKDYMGIVDRIGSDRFGMVVDIGHTRDTEGINPFTKVNAARNTMAQCGNRLIHLHLHDFDKTDHLAPLDGKIQWEEIFKAFRDIHYTGLFMFEAAWRGPKRTLDPDYVLGKMAEFPSEFIKIVNASKSP